MIHRDLIDSLKGNQKSMEAILLWGPRQTGKTTLLTQIPGLKSSVFLDDLSHRSLAEENPSLFLDGFDTPLLIDECAYAPALFPEIKLRIDKYRRQRLQTKKKTKISVQYFLTGSNKTRLDKFVKESLAGRVEMFSLSGLSVSEILGYKPSIGLKTILFKGGLPELYNRPEINPINYLNDYILSFLEKDLAREEGYGKIRQFQIVLKLLASRTGQYLNFSEVSNASGVSVPTIQAWTEMLETNKIINLLPGYYTNLTKRIIKMKKLHFYDTGLAARLQGHVSEEILWNSPQAGPLFESLVFSEIMKIKDNFRKDWRMFSWRTKEKREIDFILEGSHNRFLFIEVKMGMAQSGSWDIDPEAKKVFGSKIIRHVVTAGNRMVKSASDTVQVPIAKLKDFLLSELG